MPTLTESKHGVCSEFLKGFKMPFWAKIAQNDSQKVSVDRKREV
jgi:hypothetical protein